MVDDYNLTGLHIVGGTGSISDAQANALAGCQPGATWDRTSGPDRYATAVEVAEEWFNTATNFIIVRGNGSEPSDAMSAAALAATWNAPVLTVASTHTTPPAATAAFINARKTPTSRGWIVGGTSVVLPAIENWFENAI